QRLLRVPAVVDRPDLRRSGGAARIPPQPRAVEWDADGRRRQPRSQLVLAAPRDGDHSVRRDRVRARADPGLDRRPSETRPARRARAALRPDDDSQRQRDQLMNLDSRIPEGPIEEKWRIWKDNHELVGPRRRGDHVIAVVGTGLAGASAAATLAGMGYKVHAF